MANALRVMMIVLDVTHFMMVRRGNGNQRRGQRGAKHQGGKTDERLDDGFHGLSLYRYRRGLKREAALYRRVRNALLHGCNGRSVKYQALDNQALDIETTASRFAM